MASSFNPCFRGSGSRRRGVNLCYLLVSLRFQSLFSWIWLSKGNQEGLKWIAGRCFNPCFRGSGSRSCWHLYESHRALHVSILVFVDLALEVDPAKQRGVWLTVFQSLFSWIWLSKVENQTYTQTITLSFNPCFRGSGSRRLRSRG